MSQRTPIFSVDAFTAKPFAGNPAAVCLLDKAVDETWMQAVAAEMNLSETAFVYRLAEGFSLRWFTPRVEVPLCGHATLAAAHILWQEAWLPPTEIAHFYTKSGWLSAQKLADQIALDFPLQTYQALAVPARLSQALGVSVQALYQAGVNYLVEVASASEVRQLAPDFKALSQLACLGMIVTARSDTNHYDFVSRYFAPAAGIDEDPATGSAHCVLAPYWAERLGKLSLQAYQASARGADLYLEVKGERVLIAGQAVTISAGQLWI